MSNAVSAQHPAVGLRSTYQHLRAVLALAAIVIIGLTVAVVVLAITSGSTTASPTARATSPSTAVGPNPVQRGLQPSVPQPGPITNYPVHLGKGGALFRVGA
jgi:hypothetical protein